MQPPTLEPQIFNGVIVPNGISGKELHLSICLEFNTANSLVDDDKLPTISWPTRFLNWCFDVGRYLGDGGYDNQRYRLIIAADVLKAGFSIIGLKSTDPAGAWDWNSTPSGVDPEVARLWKDFLSLDAAAAAKAVDFPDRAKPETISTIPSGLLNTDFPPIISVRGNPDISPELILNAIRRKPPLQKLRSLDAIDRAGIQVAYEAYVRQFQQRCDFNLLSRSQVPADRAIQTLQDMNKIAGRFQLTPEYVRGAHNQLVSSPALGRLFGTTIDFIIHLLEEPSAGRSFTVKFTLPDELRTYFKIEDADMIFAVPVPGGPLRVLAAPRTTDGYNDHFKNSVMVLNKDYLRVFSFDPQAAAKAADEAQEFVAALPDEQRIRARGWDLTAGLIKNLRNSAGRPLSVTEALAVIGSLNQVQADGKQLAILRRLNNQITNLPTIGHSLYLPGFRWSAPDPDPTCPRPVQEPEVVRGYVVYARYKDGNGVLSEWMSLTRVKEDFVWRDAGSHDRDEQPRRPDEDNGIHVGGGVLCKDKPDAVSTRLDDGFLFTWPGTTLSLRSPLLHFESEGVQSGGQELANNLAHLRESIDNTNPEDTAIQLRNLKLFRVDWFPFTNFAEPPRLLAKRTFPKCGGNKVKLFFGEEIKYQYLVVAQYQNGYVPVTETLLNPVGMATDDIVKNASDWEPFLRQEHIKEVLVVLEDNIYCDTNQASQKNLKAGHPGESPTDLVVRTGELLCNAECTRFILPPQIPAFQTYLWYSHADLQGMGGSDRTMSVKELAHWHRRYSCDARTPEEFAANKRRCEERNVILPGSGGEPHGCKARCAQFCGGTRQPSVWDGVLAYLPDPVVTGFVADFFLDNDCFLPAPGFASQFCLYSKGSYPQWKPWRLILHRLPEADQMRERTKQDATACELRVWLEEGAQIFLRIVPAYDNNRAHFAKPLVDTDSIPFQACSMIAPSLTYDLLHANAKILSLTHAVQRPLFNPVIQQISIHRYNEGQPGPKTGPELASTIGVCVNLHMEHLNIKYGVAIPGTTPSGELELYALWDDFGENGLEPVKSIEDKRDPHSPNGGFVRLDGRVFESNTGDLAPQAVTMDGWRLGEAKNYWATVRFRAQSGTFNKTHFTEAVFKVRNGSKFHRYFHLEPPPPEALEAHVRWSREFKLPHQSRRVIQANGSEVSAMFLPNNRKPETPRIRKIVPLVTDERDTEDKERSVRGDRVRIYLEPNGRMHSGQAERVAVIVHEEYGMYNDYLAEFKSKAGRDIVTDNTFPDAAPALHGDQLTVHEFAVETPELESEYLLRFRPEYDRQVFGDTDAIGLVSYVPQFDAQQGLWYFDPEIRIRNRCGQELHNAFVQLGLISYQPWSANYNSTLSDDEQGYKQDMRISPPVMADFFSVYPTREFKAPYVLFRSGDWRRFSVGGSVSSLFFQKRDLALYLASQFILVVQAKDHGGFWKPMESRLTDLEFLLDGATIAERDTQTRSVQNPGLSELSHCLLPWNMGDYLHAEEFIRGRFECALALDFKPGFLRAKDGGHYRVIIYEVEWFDYDQRMEKLAASLGTADPAQIPGVRVKQTFIFH